MSIIVMLLLLGFAVYVASVILNTIVVIITLLIGLVGLGFEAISNVVKRVKQ